MAESAAVHFVGGRRYRRRGHMLQLGKSLNQLKQMGGDLRNLAAKNHTKTLADLIANCAGVYAVKSRICGILGGHRLIPYFFKFEINISGRMMNVVNGRRRIHELVKNW
jgi:hypothetical protein